MEITIIDDVKKFEDVKMGEIFFPTHELSNHLQNPFMKIEEIYTGGCEGEADDRFNAVNLVTATPDLFFALDKVVLKENSEIIVK